MTIDVLLVGPLAHEAFSWSAGEIIRGVESPVTLREVLDAWQQRTRADALLLWDPRLGNPDAALAARLVAGRGDVWHAGLRLGTQGQPGLIDFVAPSWMQNCDPSGDLEATSWRVPVAACLVRTSVLHQLGLPCQDFETIAAAFYEWGHRAFYRGALMRHVPSLVAGAVLGEHNWAAENTPSIEDEVRFIAYRYGRFWARWATGRAALTSYAPARELLRGLRRVPTRRPYDEPAPYRSGRTLGTPDLAHAQGHRPDPDAEPLRVSPCRAVQPASANGAAARDHHHRPEPERHS